MPFNDASTILTIDFTRELIENRHPHSLSLAPGSLSPPAASRVLRLPLGRGRVELGRMDNLGQSCGETPGWWLISD